MLGSIKQHSTTYASEQTLADLVKSSPSQGLSEQSEGGFSALLKATAPQAKETSPTMISSGIDPSISTALQMIGKVNQFNNLDEEQKEANTLQRAERVGEDVYNTVWQMGG